LEEMREEGQQERPRKRPVNAKIAESFESGNRQPFLLWSGRLFVIDFVSRSRGRGQKAGIAEQEKEERRVP
jgi:hypothetical protein